MAINDVAGVSPKSIE